MKTPTYAALFLFSTICTADQVILQWNYPGQSGAEGFIIQESTDCGASWVDVGVVEDPLATSFVVESSFDTGYLLYRAAAYSATEVSTRYGAGVFYCGDCQDELVRNQSASYWSRIGQNTIADDDGGVRITYVDRSEGYALFFRDELNSRFAGNDLVVGREYTLSFEARANFGEVYPRAYNGAEFTRLEALGPEYSSYSHAFVAESEINSKLQLLKLSEGEEVWIRGISLRPVEPMDGLNTP